MSYSLPCEILCNEDISYALSYYNVPIELIRIIEDKIGYQSAKDAQLFKILNEENSILERENDGMSDLLIRTEQSLGEIKEYIATAKRINRQTLINDINLICQEVVYGR